MEFLVLDHKNWFNFFRNTSFEKLMRLITYMETNLILWKCFPWKAVTYKVWVVFELHENEKIMVNKAVLWVLIPWKMQTNTWTCVNFYWSVFLEKSVMNLKEGHLCSAAQRAGCLGSGYGLGHQSANEVTILSPT